MADQTIHGAGVFTKPAALLLLARERVDLLVELLGLGMAEWAYNAVVCVEPEAGGDSRHIARGDEPDLTSNSRQNGVPRWKARV